METMAGREGDQLVPTKILSLNSSSYNRPITYMPYYILSAFHVLTHLILITCPGDRDSHHSDEW